MEPKICKPSIYKGAGAYNTPGVYNGAGGLYNGRGVYNDASEEFLELGGKSYPVVRIGSLKWIAHNLDYTDENIVIGSSTSTNGKRANYFNDDENTYGWNGRKYGLLYNTPAIEYIDSILTDGWRTATSTDWNNLIANSGDTNIEASQNLRSDNMPWYTEGQGNNSLNMNMLLSGVRGDNGAFVTGGARNEGYYNGSSLYIYDLYITGFSAYYDGKRGAQKSVRICKDA